MIDGPAVEESLFRKQVDELLKVLGSASSWASAQVGASAIVPLEPSWATESARPNRLSEAWTTGAEPLN